MAFQLLPGLNDDDTAYDWEDADVMKNHYKAIEPLDKTDKFDLKPGKLRGFLQAIQHRAMSVGWHKILNIVPNATDPDISFSLINEFGQVTLEEVRNHVIRYVDQETRTAQRSQQLFLCLMASLTSEAKAKISLDALKYTAQSHPSGALLLKVIIMEASIDTNATTKFVRLRLSSLDKYMKEIKSDIEKFNHHVKANMEILHQRGESTEDLLINLFKGYSEASDSEFRNYVKHKEELYDLENQDIEPERLMAVALLKYQTMVENGTWNAPTAEENQIIALQAQVKKLQEKSTNGKADYKKNATKKSTKKNNVGTRTNGTYEKPAWKTKAPTEGEPKTKKHNDKEYHWCNNHAEWVRHKPEDCRGTSNNKDPMKNNSEKNPKSGRNEGKNLQLAHALTSIMDDDDQE